MKTRKRELVRELLFSKSFSGKVKHRVKKELRDRATDELRTICIFRDRLRNDLRKKKLQFLLFIIARRRERAKRAFFLYLPREIARRNRNEEKRSVRAHNDVYLPRSPSERSQQGLALIVSSSLDAENAQNKKRNARRRRTQTSLSLSRLPLFCGVVRRKGSLTQREDYLRGVGLLQTKREKTHAIRFYIRKSKRYGLGYQDVEEEEEEEEEELERRRRIERRTQL